MQDGRTPLHKAAFCGHTDTAALLLDRGAAIEAQEKVSSISLMQGVARVHTDRACAACTAFVHTDDHLTPC